MTDSQEKHKWKKVAASVAERPKVQVYKGCDDLTPIPISYPSKGSIGETGDWRTYRPVIDREKCTNCGQCWMYCPEGTIQENEEGSLEIDYKYCKGCGICANSCKTGALTMVRESDAKDAQRKKNGISGGLCHDI